ncbi:site-specific integrase [Streptococcus iniae]|uniref:tyrosine-type recombinase/integrase n=1 Tax=Streptococcus iniae TaxID=1346 RepID=UPI0008DABE74|nr:site-specific integrase [Streptococcus iniae]OHX27232.1 hypothetical protein BKX95_06180 [Streptococcus iniae]RLV27653.1 site-specific integrase [Streptococcus iniae]
MFYKKLSSGKFRYYEKYYHEIEKKWKQVSTTLNSKSRQAQAQAKLILFEKIEVAQNQVLFLEHLKVSDVIGEWLSIRESELKESTYLTQKHIVDLFVRKFANKELEKISSLEMQRYLLADKKWSSGYRSLSKVIISLFFTYCVKVGYLSESPMDRVVLPKHQKTHNDLQKSRDKFLSKEDMKTYLRYLKDYGSNHKVNLLIEFLYLTGLRSGEALGLMWDSVDIKNKIITISQTLHHRSNSKNYYLTTPKTLSGYRRVSINSRVVEILEELSKEEGMTSFVFETEHGYPFYLDYLNYYLKKTFEKTSIYKSDQFRMTSHVLRHSHISLLVEMNIPIRLIMDRVGHSDEKTTMKIYTHVTQTMQDNLSSQLELIAT